VEIRKTKLPGVLLLFPKVHADDRGRFFESYRADLLTAAGVPPFVQDNQSSSRRGTVRGLHYQLDRPQGKLIRVLRGSIFDAVVDIRVGSPTFGQWLGEVLSADNNTQLYVPPGFGHGFQVLEDGTDVLYKCTDYYSGAADQRGVAWNDPSIGIAWPLDEAVLSDKDRVAQPLRPDRADLPRYAP
jgi:dTDP-4-dehydrorhamnose 3,5-epimerase